MNLERLKELDIAIQRIMKHPERDLQKSLDEIKTVFDQFPCSFPYLEHCVRETVIRWHLNVHMEEGETE